MPGFMPRRLREGADPLSIVLVGIVFALVFDTATQAAAWGYAATAGGGTGLALLAGLAFTAGMVATDSVDGRLMVRLLRQAGDGSRAAAYRRRIGWGVVLMSYGMAAYAIGGALRPDAGLGDAALSALGVGLFCAALLAYGLERRRARVAPSATRPAP
jgi:high-affinity nickel-transport protein